MIIANNIHKSFGSVEILKGISVEIKRREIVAIVGPSGAGKTTFLQIMGTLLKPSSGTIIINNVEVQNLSDNQLAQFRNQHIGFVFQFHHLLPEFTALENVCIPAFISNKNRKKTEQKAAELLRYLNLGHRIDFKPAQLSGGEQQRVAVARALINDPEVIFADEPSGNLDMQNKTDLHNLFFKLRDNFGHTIVVVTHSEELAQMSDRRIIMNDGLITNA